MKNEAKAAIVAMIPVLTTTACDPAPDTYGGGTWGTVQDLEGDADETSTELDAPDIAYGELELALAASATDEVDEVWVRIDEVRGRHFEHGWVVVSDEVVTLELGELVAGTEGELALEQVPTGRYNGFSVHVDKAWVVVDGRRFALEVPQADGGISVPFRVVMPECDTLDVLLHWDVRRGLHTEPRYVLDPTLRVRTAEFAGSCGAAGGGGSGGGSEGGEIPILD